MIHTARIISLLGIGCSVLSSLAPVHAREHVHVGALPRRPGRRLAHGSSRRRFRRRLWRRPVGGRHHRRPRSPGARRRRAWAARGTRRRRGRRRPAGTADGSGEGGRLSEHGARLGSSRCGGVPGRKDGAATAAGSGGGAGSEAGSSPSDLRIDVGGPAGAGAVVAPAGAQLPLTRERRAASRCDPPRPPAPLDCCRVSSSIASAAAGCPAPRAAKPHPRPQR